VDGVLVAHSQTRSRDTNSTLTTSRKRRSQNSLEGNTEIDNHHLNSTLPRTSSALCRVRSVRGTTTGGNVGCAYYLLTCDPRWFFGKIKQSHSTSLRSRDLSHYGARHQLIISAASSAQRPGARTDHDFDVNKTPFPLTLTSWRSRTPAVMSRRLERSSKQGC
jgi:hypothetical protein